MIRILRTEITEESVESAKVSAPVSVPDSSPSPAGSSYTTASESGHGTNDSDSGAFISASEEIKPLNQAAVMAQQIEKVIFY